MNFLTFWNNGIDNETFASALNRFLSQNDGLEAVLLFCLWYGWAGYGRIKMPNLRIHVAHAYQHQGLNLAIKRLREAGQHSLYASDIETLSTLARQYQADTLNFQQVFSHPKKRKPSHMLNDMCNNLISYCKVLEQPLSPNKHLDVAFMLHALLPNTAKEAIDKCWAGHWTRLLRMYPYFKNIPTQTVQPI